MADTVDSLSITLTADTSSAEESINKLIGRLALLKVAVQGASNFTKISAGIKRIADAAKQIDTDSGKKLSDLARGLTDLGKVGDLSNLADAGKNLSSVVRAVNSMGQTGGNGLSNLADGIKQTSDALGSVKDADVSKLGAVRDALSGEMSGSLHQANQNVIEHPALGGSVAQNYDMGLVNPGAVSIYEQIAYAIGEATVAHREFRAEVGSGGGIAGLLGEGTAGGAIAVFKYTAASIRDATSAYREFQAALSGGATRMLPGGTGGRAGERPLEADEIRDAARAYDDVGNSASRAADVIETEFVNPFANFKMKPLEDELPRVTLNPIDRSVADSVNNAAGAFGNLSNVLGGLSGVLGPVASGLIAIPKYFGGQLIGNIQKSTKGLTGFFHSIVRIAKYRLIRSALRMITQGINQGMKNLYAFSQAASGTFAASMDRIATASQYLGNSFAAMASPLVEALAPAIDFVVDKVVAMFNTISQIIARLTGKSTYTAAKKVAATWSGAAKSAGKGASDSAKEAVDEIKRTIMGFDEINKLNEFADNSSGGGSGGGGGGGAGAGAMFEELPIDSEISNFADALKEAFLAGDWQELGTLLGTKVNELVDSIDWAGAGATVGYYINGWFSTKYWTLDTINFTKIGSKIAEFLNNAINEIHFDIIGASLVQKLTIIGDLVIGFFETFDWGQASEKFSNFVGGIFDELSKWLEKTDWMKLGESIVNNIVDAITGFDYADVVNSIAEFIGSLLGAAIKLITGLRKAIGEKIGEAFNGIGEFFNEQIEACGGDIVGGILRGIIVGLTNIAVWIVENIFQPFINGFKKAFGIASPAKEMYGPGEDIMNGVLQGILNVISTIGQWIIDNVFSAITQAFTLAETVVQSLAAIGETIINTVLGGILNVMGGIVNWVATNIIKPLMDAFTKDDEEEQGEDFSSKLWEAIKGKWEDSNRKLTVTLAADKTAEDIWSVLNTTWNADTRELPVTVKFGESGDLNVPSSVDVKVGLVKDGWTSLADWISSSWVGYYTVKLQKLDSDWTSLANWISSKWEGYYTVKLQKLTSDWTSLADWISSSWVGYYTVKLQRLDSDWTSLADWISKKWEGYYTVKLQRLDSDWTSLADWISKKWEGYYTVKLQRLDSDWTSLADWISKKWEGYYTVKLQKLDSDWTSLAGWIDSKWNGFYTVKLQKDSTWTSLADWIDSKWSGFYSVILQKMDWTSLVDWISDTWEGTFTIKLKSEGDKTIDDVIGFGGATGGGGGTSGGGAGRTINVTVNGTPGTGFDSNLSGKNKYKLAGIEDSVAKVSLSKADPNATTGGLFGTSYTAQATITKSNPNSTTGGLFGTSYTANASITKADANSTTGGLFGTSYTANASITKADANSTTGGLFGTSYTAEASIKKKNDNTTTGGLFGTSYTAEAGLKKENDKTTTAKLFGESYTAEAGLKKKKKGTTTGGLFGTSYTAKATAKATNKTKDIFDTAITVKATLSNAIGGLSNFVKTIKDKIADAVKAATKAKGGVIQNGHTWDFATGGIINNSVARRLANVPHYAGGTTDAHGTVFIAGEAGPEIMGHIGGRTEILNQSQLAQTMFAAVRSAMSGVKLGGYIKHVMPSDNSESDYETMYRAMYDAFTDAMTGSDERDKEKVQLMRQIAAKEFTAEVTANSVNRAQTRMNRRAGMTIVPVGT